MIRKIIFCFLIVWSHLVSAQCLQPVNLVKQKDLPMAFPAIQTNLTAHRDTNATKPYLYICAKGGGLIVYNISSITSPTLVATIGIASLNNLHVMNCTQAGNYLFLALGDHFNATAQKSGMAIVNITNPASPTVTSTYSYTSVSGAGHVAIEGNYAYLSAMQNGIIVLDVTNKSNIIFKSAFKPSVNFPKPSPSASEIQKINVRQVVAKNDVLYVCYDAGGVRVVNASNKTNLLETGKYSNPLLLSKPRAYNNLVLNDSLVYVAADYAGMEVLKVKDTSNITQIGWWNPWKSDTPSNTWFNSLAYANEIEFDPQCRMLFITAGPGDLYAVNVTNPSLPDSCARYGSTGDSLGSWGLGRYKNQIYLSYLVTGVPFYANWGGTKILTYNNNCSVGINEPFFQDKINIHPNPAKDVLYIKPSDLASEKNSEYKIINSMGQECKHGKFQTTIPIQDIPDGLYTLQVISHQQIVNYKFIKE